QGPVCLFVEPKRWRRRRGHTVHGGSCAKIFWPRLHSGYDETLVEEVSMSLLEKIKADGRKKILALDGGGIRGILSVEILARIETLLREKLGKDDNFVLADYFDFFS